MNLHTVESHLDRNLHNTTHELASDLKAEAKHFADPAQCGSIVQRHFDGLAFSVLGFVTVVLVVAVVALAAGLLL